MLRPLLVLPLVAGTAHAQQPSSAEAPEEIVVTVRRKAEPAAELPMSFAAITAETLRQSGVQGTLDLAQVAPGLVVSRFGVLTQPALRGVTTRLGENSVATYIDGFYVPNAVSLDADFNRIERVDVLKGPQGTLFGRNATGGAILITTPDPRREPTFEASLGVEDLDGSLDGRALRLYGSTALGEAAAVDVALTSRESNGWIYNITGGDPVNEQERQNLRAKLVVEPGDATKISITAEHGTLEDPTVTGALSFYSHRLFPPVFPPNPALPSPATPNIVATSHAPRNDAEWDAVYGKVEWSNDMLAVVSLTSYRTDDNVLDMDFDGSAAVNPPAFGGTNLAWELGEKTLQQEIDFRSTRGGRLDWLAGLHVFDDQIDQLFLPNNAVGAQTEGAAAAETLAVSAFADFTYAATDALELTAGARYSREEKEARYSAALPPAAFAGEVDFSDFTPRLAARYELSPEASVYASASQGFKSGLVSASGEGVSSTEPEELTAYEIGYKARRGELDLDLAAYVYDWEDIQVARFEPTAGGNVVQNAARARIRGVEAQAAWRVGERTQLRANAAYTDGEYRDFPNATVTVSAQPDDPAFPNNLVPQAQDWSGSPTIRTPEWTANFGFSYAWSARFSFTGNVYYTSEFAPNTAREHPVTGEPDLISGPYTLVNLGLTFAPSDAWSLTLYGRNLTDELYILSRDANVFGEYRAFGEPRVIGLRFNYASR